MDFDIPYRFYDPAEYDSLLVQEGLTPLRAELIPKDMTHQDAEGLCGWFRTTWLPFIERIPEQVRADFVTECVQSYLDKHPLDAEGNSHMGMTRLEMEAEKPGRSSAFYTSS